MEDINISEIQDVAKRIDTVNDKLDAAKSLFGLNPDNVNSDQIDISGVNVKTLIDAGKFLVLLASYKKEGTRLPMHKHNDSVEYLVAVNGRSALMLPGNNVRIMNHGDCATIPTGMEHTTVSLEDDVELLAICIPPEKAYQKA